MAAQVLELPPDLKELRMEGFLGVKLPLEFLDYFVEIVNVNCNMLKEVTLAKAARTTLCIKNCPKFALAFNMEGSLLMFTMQ
ncbi:hypothetical protein Sjap_008789 [Stephania japonica]|uniref:Uncharacterized protein n=1 Tax=Stephania japonica TaxID=461633 RepID=A0AAP0JSH6_9MAGN